MGYPETRCPLLIACYAYLGGRIEICGFGSLILTLGRLTNYWTQVQEAFTPNLAKACPSKELIAKSTLWDYVFSSMRGGIMMAALQSFVAR